jgi:hypothetical protein
VQSRVTTDLSYCRDPTEPQGLCFLFGLLRFGGLFRFGRLFARVSARSPDAFVRTISGALGTIGARAAVGSVAVGSFAFSFAGFLASFGTTAAFFGLLFFFPGFGCGWSFDHRQRSAAFDADLEFGDDVRVEAEFDVVFAQNADRVFEMDFALVEGDVELGLELIGDQARSNRAEHFAVLAGLDGDDANELGEALGELGHGVEIVGFTFGAALLEDFKAAFVRASERNCKSLGKEIIAGVTSGDLDLVGFAAEADDVVR